jgi:hypothetical protein
LAGVFLEGEQAYTQHRGHHLQTHLKNNKGKESKPNGLSESINYRKISLLKKSKRMY